MKKPNGRDLIQATLASVLPPRRRREVVLAILGVDLAAIATDVGTSRQAVSKTAKGFGRSEKIENGFAARVSAEAGFEVKVEELFPEFYGPPRDASEPSGDVPL
jgi:hypothetical protein